MSNILIDPPEGTFWSIKGPQDDLTLAITRKKDYTDLAQCKITQNHGPGAISRDVRNAQKKLLKMLSDLLALQSIKDEFLEQEASA